MELARDPAYFSWSVAQAGHRWMKTKQLPSGEENRYLTTGIPLGQTFMRARYNPMVESGLFRNFSELEPTEEAICQFANRWGLLGGEASTEIGVVDGPQPKSLLLGVGELLSTWTSESTEMKSLLEIWDLAHNRDKKLAAFIKWGDARVWYEGPRIEGWPENVRSRREIASGNSPELLAKFQTGDLIGPAQQYLQGEVNKKLTHHGVSARLLWDQNYTRLSLYLVPQSLIGCLWLQFARAIDGNRDYRRCPICRKWFEITFHVSRKDRAFCTPTCKARAHKQKITEARQLKKEGMDARAIAKKLDTPLATLRGWLK